MMGFIGQGWVGKQYADYFERRGYYIVRYGLEPQYRANQSAIARCDPVFIAVPTPTTPDGFDGRSVREAIALTAIDTTIVIKSTIPPGSTIALQKDFPDRYIFHVPEFLREAHARHDVECPERLLIGNPVDGAEHWRRANALVDILPRAKHTRITTSTEAEVVKYTHNVLGYATVVLANVLYDYASAHGVPWSHLRSDILNNPWFPSKYLDPLHNGGRGAGGDCFIKDFAQFAAMYGETVPQDRYGLQLLVSFIEKNNRLLRDSGKDLELLNRVHGGDDEAKPTWNQGATRDREQETH